MVACCRRRLADGGSGRLGRMGNLGLGSRSRDGVSRRCETVTMNVVWELWSFLGIGCSLYGAGLDPRLLVRRLCVGGG